MSLKQRLRAGELIVSTMVGEVRSASLPRILATAGLDSFIIDMEHGALDWSEMATLITVGRAVGIHPVVRIPEVRRETVLKPLDAGASGILVPMVSSAEEVETIVRWSKYPPDGARGVSLRRGHNDFGASPLVDHLVNANAETFVMVQIESAAAMDAIDELVAVDGLDAVFIGPNDLSVALGVPGELQSDTMRDAYRRVVGAAKACGVAVGFQAFAIPEARELIDLGVRYLSYSTDVNALLDRAAEAADNLSLEKAQS